MMMNGVLVYLNYGLQTTHSKFSTRIHVNAILLFYHSNFTLGSSYTDVSKHTKFV